MYFGQRAVVAFSFLVDGLGFSAGEVDHFVHPDLPATATAVFVYYTHPRLQISFGLTPRSSFAVYIILRTTRGYGKARGLHVFTIEELARAHGEPDDIIVPRRGVPRCDSAPNMPDDLD